MYVCMYVYYNHLERQKKKEKGKITRRMTRSHGRDDLPVLSPTD
jgi:hypothetical protein